jgi:hypothetical protein
MDNLKFLAHLYEEQLERHYGFIRSYHGKVIYLYLDCGNQHNRFAASMVSMGRLAILR